MKRDAWKALGPLTALAGLAALFTAGAASCATVLGIQDVEERGEGGAGGVIDGEGGSGGVINGAGGSGGVINGQGGMAGAAPVGLSCDDPIQIEFDESGLPTSFAKDGQAVIYGSISSKSVQSLPVMNCSFTGGPEHIYAITNKHGGILTATVSSGATEFDSVLYAVTDCMDPSTAISCADRNDPFQAYKGGEVLSFPMAKGDTVYLFVDGRTDIDQGKYKLTLSVRDGGDCGSTIPITIAPGTPMTLRGQIAGAQTKSDAAGTCGFLNLRGFGGELIYELSALSGISSVDLQLGKNTSFDSVLYAWRACTDSGTQLKCVDDKDSGESITLPASSLPAYIYVDSPLNSPGGNFELTVTPK